MINTKNNIIEFDLAPNTLDNPHDEPGIKLVSLEYGFGLDILPDGPTVKTFANDEYTFDILNECWSGINMSSIVHGCLKERGMEGLVEACRTFLQGLSERISKSIDNYYAEEHDTISVCE